MTIVRMLLWHGVKTPSEERRKLVKFLADSQGLAPEETAPHRAILERRPNFIEREEDTLLMQICARCHTYGRSALQRRDEAEWVKLSHTHVGQYPTIEYQAMARDRKWWEIASTTVPKRLGQRYPFQTEAWTDWSRHTKANLAGKWRVVGHRTGKGAYTGKAEFSVKGNDIYATLYEWTYEDGTRVHGKGSSIVYTGYEWRGRATIDDEKVKEVYSLSTDGNELSGRWFLSEADEIGGEFRAIREIDGQSRILAAFPSYIRAGEADEITIHGIGLNGEVELGEGLRIVETISADADAVVLRVKAKRRAQSGARKVKVGDAEGDGLLTVFRKIDYVKVEPDYTIARVGGNGGPLPPVTAQFESVAYMNGPDDKPETGDDIRIGVVAAE